MKTKRFKIIIILCTWLSVVSSLHAQAERRIELTAQEILARVDRVLDYPGGLIKGKLVHITPDGKSSTIEVLGYISDEDFLFKFSTKWRGEELRVLYNLNGEDIWVYDVLSIKLFNKRGIDRYDSILGTNFYYIDLSNADFQSNYTAEITGEAFVKGRDTYKLKLNPVMRSGEYGLITLYAGKKDFVPLRIDFHDQDRVIFKTLSIAKVITRNDRIIPVRYDMLDIRKGTVTLLEFYGFDEEMSFDKKTFIHENLGKAE